MRPDEAERWQRVKAIVADALELGPAEREAFVREACARDDELRLQVMGLLALERNEYSTSTIDKSQAPPNVPGFQEVPDSQSRDKGRRIGPYVLQHRIGTGGVGQVFLAIRTDNVKMRVAIKFLRPEHLGVQGFARRFKAEMQILALLSHRHIVNLLDAGTADGGEPYFVMEYVEGVPIDRYCSQQRLSAAQRLQLFLDVCGAVQYAHNHLLVHRDLKPSNILVDLQGTVKLLDFGIAKLLVPELMPDAQLTKPHSQPFTPEYASPEQLSGGPVSTATDIFSLAVVLYKMLTGTVPFPIGKKPFPEYQKMVCEEEPSRPSLAVHGDAASVPQKRLKGELDNILLMGLRKEPGRRYATVTEFADDLRRFLAGFPVKAQPDTLAYRSGKFVRRHRVGLAAAAITLAGLISGLTTALYQRARAEKQRAVAEVRLTQVRALAQSFRKTFASVEQNCLDSALAQRATAQAERQLASRPADRQLQQHLARSFEVLIDVLSRNGDLAGALESSRKAVAIRERLAASDPQDMLAQEALATERARLSELMTQTKRAASSVLGAVGAVPVAQNQSLTELARGYYEIGQMLQLTGDAVGAVDAYQMSAQLYEQTGEAESTPAGVRKALSQTYLALADTYRQYGEPAKATEFEKKAQDTDPRR